METNTSQLARAAGEIAAYKQGETKMLMILIKASAPK
jgi:hypothetical protein